MHQLMLFQLDALVELGETLLGRPIPMTVQDKLDDLTLCVSLTRMLLECDTQLKAERIVSVEGVVLVFEIGWEVTEVDDEAG